MRESRRSAGRRAPSSTARRTADRDAAPWRDRRGARDSASARTTRPRRADRDVSSCWACSIASPKARSLFQEADEARQNCSRPLAEPFPIGLDPLARAVGQQVALVRACRLLERDTISRQPALGGGLEGHEVHDRADVCAPRQRAGIGVDERVELGAILPGGGAVRVEDWSAPARRSIPARASRRPADAELGPGARGERERRSAAAVARSAGGPWDGRRRAHESRRAARRARAERPRLKTTRDHR